MRVLVYSGSRADYGGLESVVSALLAQGIEVSFYQSEKFDIDLVSIPDLAIVLGDRFEVLRAAVELYLRKVPIAHLSGGDITEGSQDDCMRHAITKLSHLHFVTNEVSANRVIQMGEEPWRVHVVGYPGIDDPELIDINEAKKQAGIEYFPDDFVMVIWHPNTLVDDILAEWGGLLISSSLFDRPQGVLIIGPNFDVGHKQIIGCFKPWVELRKAEKSLPTHYVERLPREVYLTLLANCKVLIGNSSSGYYEAPSFGTPVVDIGDRQKGREGSSNIIHSIIDADNIRKAIDEALSKPRTKPYNPYYTGNASERIASVIAKIENPKELLLKRFCDIKQ